jgi:ESS family glutamate:Na+ symporter
VPEHKVAARMGDTMSDIHRVTVPDFLSLTIGIVVFFVGVLITQRLTLLRNFSIPEPVSGGFVAVALISLIYFFFNYQIDFNLTTRDRLLVIFFAAVGINARFADLFAGGRTLLYLCLVSAAFVFIQNFVGTVGALAFGMPFASGVVMGSMALSGGHGTTIAWAPLVATEHHFPAAMETGIAVATLGLVIACVLGGPLAKYLIERHCLSPSPENQGLVELAPEDDRAPIDKISVMQAMLVVNIAVILGYLLHDWISNATDIKVPLFVPCLIMGMFLSNTVPILFPRLPWPARTASLDLLSSYALSVFLAMSLMSMQLWTLAKIAGPLIIVVGAQTVVATAYIVLVVFPALGKDYQAAVLSGGFTGISLGSTPTAIAAMTAVTKRYGPSPNASVILPLVSALFVSLVNVGAITLFLSLQMAR